MKLNDLPTPCALIDEDRMVRNIVRMQSRVSSLGCLMCRSDRL